MANYYAEQKRAFIAIDKVMEQLVTGRIKEVNIAALMINITRDYAVSTKAFYERIDSYLVAYPDIIKEGVIMKKVDYDE